MIRLLLAYFLAVLVNPAYADCQDNCSNGEAVCVESCTPGVAGFVCTMKCSKTASTCAKACPPAPKPEPKPDPKTKGLSNTTSWRAAFPLDTSNSKFSTASCCAVGGVKGPLCAYVLCTEEPINKTTRDWSGKLFDSNSSARPKNIMSQCNVRPSPVCSLIETSQEAGDTSSPTEADMRKFRQHLEAFRRSTDYGRLTGQISVEDQKRLLDAYKRDYREAFGRSK